MSENGDGMDHLRIPFEKIKFGKKLEGHGYGTVFEGEFGDRRVALKQLNITNLGNVKPKLLGEILTISRFRQHPNLVALLGFCDERSNEIILVYEYVAGGDLADKMRKRLTTIQRYEICLGAARGLDYLHTGVDSTPGIVHGHIKLSKILLNSDTNSSKFEAKLSSFGLSKIVPGKAQSTDPEDEVTEKATKESDVYSFGVLLLEVLCGVSELVDTDDYHERHVSELVPKRLQQNNLRKIVHFDIRRDIKTESLETYAKIACQCVSENPEARPTMAQVVEELEKALVLQGGEVSFVHIPGSQNINGGADETPVDEGPKEGSNGVTVHTETLDKEPQETEIVAIEEDPKEVISDVAGENDGGEIDIVGIISSDSTNDEKNSEDNITVQERSFEIPIIEGVNGENLPDETQTEGAQKENSNTVITTTPDPETLQEITDDLNSKDESNITAENEDDNQSITQTEVVEREISGTVIASTDDSETTEEIIEDINSKEESKVGDENEDDNQSGIINDPKTTEEITNDSNYKEESNINGDNQNSTQIEDAQSEISNSVITSTNDHGSNSKEESEPEIPESGDTLQKETGDGLDYLRIPFQKIKFGKKIDIHGYGSLYEGEFENQDVALKRLNITNLGNIKPKLLSEILNVARFRKHPNIVALIGFCDEKSNEIIIVYEYVSGGNLADNLSKHLTTIQRLEICLGAARGVDYLHSGLNPTPGTIHGDIKLSKILLKPDSNSSKFEAKVSSFGLSKLLPGQSRKNLDLDTEDKTKEFDVYSFGVILLEVLCGVPELVDTDDYQERHVTELVPKRLQQNLLRKIVHFDIRDEIKTEALETYAKIACWCVKQNADERPTMTRVVEELEKALKLQAGDVSEVEVLSNGNGLAEKSVDEVDREGEDNGEKLVVNATEKEYKAIEEAKVDDIAENTTELTKEQTTTITAREYSVGTVKPAKLEKTSSGFSIWPPTQHTRDTIIKRVIETLSDKSVLFDRYDTIPVDEAASVARRIEEEAFNLASASPIVDDDDGIKTLQCYSKEISKRTFDSVKSTSA